MAYTLIYSPGHIAELKADDRGVSGVRFWDMLALDDDGRVVRCTAIFNTAHGRAAAKRYLAAHDDAQTVAETTAKRIVRDAQGYTNRRDWAFWGIPEGTVPQAA